MYFFKFLSVPALIIQTLWALSFFSYLLGDLNSSKRTQIVPPFTPLLTYILISSLLLIFSPHPQSQSYAGAHYYFWFPENWVAGYGDKNTKPSRGEYSSETEDIIRSHIIDLKTKGFNLVILDWWPRNPSLKHRAFKFVKILKEFPEMSFAIHLETLELGLDKDSDLITLNQKRVNDLTSFIKYAGKKLFSNPQYLMIDKKPAVFLYASRHLVGPMIKGLNEVRVKVRESTGLTPFFIGDEVFYQVPEGRDSKSALLLPKYIPNWDRLRAFDAITLYNPYDPTREYLSLKENDSSDFLIETTELYYRYQDISNHLRIPFIKTCIPAYNDTAIRPLLQHQVIPQTDKNGVNTLNALRAIISDIDQKESPFILTTSYNEWNEGTNIEK